MPGLWLVFEGPLGHLEQVLGYHSTLGGVGVALGEGMEAQDGARSSLGQATPRTQPGFC